MSVLLEVESFLSLSIALIGYKRNTIDSEPLKFVTFMKIHSSLGKEWTITLYLGEHTGKFFYAREVIFNIKFQKFKKATKKSKRDVALIPSLLLLNKNHLSGG